MVFNTSEQPTPLGLVRQIEIQSITLETGEEASIHISAPEGAVHSHQLQSQLDSMTGGSETARRIIQALTETDVLWHLVSHPYTIVVDKNSGDQVSSYLNPDAVSALVETSYDQAISRGITTFDADEWELLQRAVSLVKEELSKENGPQLVYLPKPVLPGPPAKELYQLPPGSIWFRDLHQAIIEAHPEKTLFKSHSVSPDSRKKNATRICNRLAFGLDNLSATYSGLLVIQQTYGNNPHTRRKTFHQSNYSHIHHPHIYKHSLPSENKWVLGEMFLTPQGVRYLQEATVGSLVTAGFWGIHDRGHKYLQDALKALTSSS